MRAPREDQHKKILGEKGLTYTTTYSHEVSATLNIARRGRGKNPTGWLYFLSARQAAAF